MITKVRTAIFWLHLAVGMTAGLFILSMAVSGLSIVYERQITAWAERGQRAVTVPTNAQRLGVEALTVKVAEALPDSRLASVSLYSAPTTTAVFTVGRDDPLFVNPYTGETIGEGSKPTRAFFRFMTGWHRWLALEGPAQPIGKAITGVAAIAYFVLVLSGLYIWLPRRWSRNNLSRIMLFKRGLQGKARDWNWHNVIGIWCAPVLLVVTLTGIIMAYPWANNLLFSLSGSPPPEQRGERRGPGGRPGGRGGPEHGPAKLDLRGMDALWEKAEHQVEGWQSISLRFATSPQEPAIFNIDRGNGARPDLKSQLTLNRRTGEVLRWQPYADQSKGQKLRIWTRFLHTGEAGGWSGQTVAAIAACGGIMLVWTGLCLTWRRFFGKRNAAAEPLLLEAVPGAKPSI